MEKKELKEIVLNKPYYQILKKIKEFDFGIPFGYSAQEFYQSRESVLNEIKIYFSLNTDNFKTIVTGHQPEIHHPGILFKDILAHKISLQTGFIPIHLIVDTDQFDFNYSIPLYQNNSPKVENLTFNHSSIFNFYQIKQDEKKKLKNILIQSKDKLELFVFKPENSILYIDEFLNLLEQDIPICKISEKLDNDFFNQFDLKMYHLPVSSLCKFQAFKLFVEKIRERQKEFIDCYNNSLNEYRKIHKIKNLAQPLPNLSEDEMPFWTLGDDGVRKYMKITDPNINIIPRAITLTMFNRLLFANYFIHGTGGGKYEEVCDLIINKFFKVNAAPYCVASATMNLSYQNQFNIELIDQIELEKRMRSFQHSPEDFLIENHPLRNKKSELINEFKNPNVNKKEIHLKLVQLNQEIQNELGEVNNKLTFQKEHIIEIEKIYNIYQTRKFPFYYYNMEELVNVEIK